MEQISCEGIIVCFIRHFDENLCDQSQTSAADVDDDENLLLPRWGETAEA